MRSKTSTRPVDGAEATAISPFVWRAAASTPTANDPYANEKDAFKAAVTAVELAAIAGGATDGGHVAVLEDYHAQLVPPFCLAAVKSFFDGQGG